MKNKFNGIFGAFLILLIVSSFVSAEDTYIESMNKIRDQIAQSETNIKSEINSFQGAFEDTFKLIDDEISRLIFANAAMVGLVFAIMFLVYAKTSSRSRRDMQVMLVAHSKHMDNMISARLDEFARRMELMFEERRKEQMSSLESMDGVMKGSLAEGFERADRTKKQAEPVAKKDLIAVEKMVENNVPLAEEKTEKKGMFGFLGKKKPIVKEAEKTVDGKVLVPKEPSDTGNRFFKRIKRGLLRILGRNKASENVEEFKLK